MIAEYILTLKPISLNNAYNNVRGRGRVKTKEYDTWKMLACRELRIQSQPHIECAYRLFIRVGRKLTKADIDNLVKPISDALVAIGATPDDRKMTGVDIAYEDRSDTLIRILETET